jgi:uncharacterized protein YodC (DUF2158 family)
MEEQDKIVVGSTVRLRDIPGPLMRVIRIQNDQATCFWFNRSNEPHEDQFAVILLMKCAPYVHRPREEGYDPRAAERFERETAPVETASADH